MVGRMIIKLNAFSMNRKVCSSLLQKFLLNIKYNHFMLVVSSIYFFKTVIKAFDQYPKNFEEIEETWTFVFH